MPTTHIIWPTHTDADPILQTISGRPTHTTYVLGFCIHPHSAILFSDTVRDWFDKIKYSAIYVSPSHPILNSQRTTAFKSSINVLPPSTMAISPPDSRIDWHLQAHAVIGLLSLGINEPSSLAQNLRIHSQTSMVTKKWQSINSISHFHFGGRTVESKKAQLHKVCKYSKGK